MPLAAEVRRSTGKTIWRASNHARSRAPATAPAAAMSSERLTVVENSSPGNPGSDIVRPASALAVPAPVPGCDVLAPADPETLPAPNEPLDPATATELTG